MSVALVLTVKNEDRILQDNCRYHRAIGATHLFVYFDDSTDGGKESLQGLDYVSISDSVPEERYGSIPELKKFTSQAGEHHTARQCLNTYDALLKCREMGIDWLISLDADELVATDLDEPSDLPIYFDKMPSEVEVVQLQTLEFLQDRESYDNVFAEGVWFKTTPRFRNRIETISKKFYNPFANKFQKFNYWYGQHLGKVAMRVDCDLIPHNVHKAKYRDGSLPNSVEKGHILHYHAYDAKDFIKKFTNFSNHPDTFLSGNRVENIKLLLRDVINKSNLSQDQLVSYFKQNLMFSLKEIERLNSGRYLKILKRKSPAIIQVHSVTKVFKKKLE